MATQHPGKVAYVVVIPQSTQAPHMASDHRYYKRFNFQSVFMEDYEVRDVSRRLMTPLLALQLESSPLNLSPADYARYEARLNITALIVNGSPAPAEYARVRIGVQEALEIVGAGKEFATGHTTIRFNDESIPVRLFTDQYGIPQKMPIWQGVRWRVGSFEILVPRGLEEAIILWDISAPGMRAQKGTLAIARSPRGEVRMVERPDLMTVACFLDESS